MDKIVDSPVHSLHGQFICPLLSGCLDSKEWTGCLATTSSAWMSARDSTVQGDQRAEGVSISGSGASEDA